MIDRSSFTRTKCACRDCVACCKRQPGPLAPGDYERIQKHLGATDAEMRSRFWASPGALIKELITGKVHRVGTITPRMRRGRCVFLDDNDRCSIHEVAPFGCAYFDPHMTPLTAHPRSIWLARVTDDPDYQALRDTLPYATSYKPSGY
jgi:Fe-S-cluster containining protein